MWPLSLSLYVIGAGLLGLLLLALSPKQPRERRRELLAATLIILIAT